MQQKSEDILMLQENATAQEQILEAKNDSFPQEAESTTITQETENTSLLQKAENATILQEVENTWIPPEKVEKGTPHVQELKCSTSVGESSAPQPTKSTIGQVSLI